ncbi:MAG: viperin family antiviral radical SAM protein [Thermoplasmatota archaeon]
MFLTSLCNYQCRFCFATFPELRVTMPETEARQILDEFASAGVRRVTFVGGEPTLLPYLPALLAYAKNIGLATCLVTNASRLDETYLGAIAPTLDILTVSIDSFNDGTEAQLGRGDGAHVRQAIWALREGRRLGVFTKLNSVITRLNVGEDFAPLLVAANPHRWKPLQMLIIKGENDGEGALGITTEEFHAFAARHARFLPIAEDNDTMTESYVMVDPEGRIFQNTGGIHVRGPHVLAAGFVEALNEVTWSAAKFKARGGDYSWQQ